MHADAMFQKGPFQFLDQTAKPICNAIFLSVSCGSWLEAPKFLTAVEDIYHHPPISSYIHLNAPGAKQQPALATVCRWLGTSRFSTDARSSRFRRRRTGRAKQAALPKSSQGSCQVLALSRNGHIIHIDPLESTRLSEPWSCFTCRRLSCLFNSKLGKWRQSRWPSRSSPTIWSRCPPSQPHEKKDTAPLSGIAHMLLYSK